MTIEEHDQVAIIGLACRFPGAENKEQYWHNLIHGVESIRPLTDAELIQDGVLKTQFNDPAYIKVGGVLDQVKSFDAAFFGYSPKEASLMDPQHRLFLELCWEALEDSTYAPDQNPYITGVYAGLGGIVSSFLNAYGQTHKGLQGQTGSMVHIGNDKDFISTRISYKLNLKGPSINVQTACSTSSVAVHMAMQSIINGECDVALAGAANVRFPHYNGYITEKGNILSNDGHIRAFDAQATGTIFTSGGGVVVLKRLDLAKQDRDYIYAVIKSSSINNDGGDKVSYTASSVPAQTQSMIEAMTLAQISPASITYIESHGTGTIVGDPLEIQALTNAFRHETNKSGFCALGSVKPNIGHLEQASGIASIIKVALALKYQQLPPSINFNKPNPRIKFNHSPFFVNISLRDWKKNDEQPLRAGINSLGLGGTNAFLILEEAPTITKQERASEQQYFPINSQKDQKALITNSSKTIPNLFALSADNQQALNTYTKSLVSHKY